MDWGLLARRRSLALALLLTASPAVASDETILRDLSVNYVAAKARLIERAHPDDDARILAAARLVAERFAARARAGKMLPKRAIKEQVALEGAIKRLAGPETPADARLAGQAAEFIAADQLCDSAARALQFLLAQIGYTSVQLNLATGTGGGHSALVVTRPDGTKAFVDPYLGVAAFRAGRLLGIDEFATALRNGTKPRALLIPLKKDASYQYYARWNRIPSFYAENGQNIAVDVTLPPTRGRIVYLGKRDKSFADVVHAGNKAGLTSYFHYLGAMYDTAWIRTLRAKETVVLQMVLMTEPKAEVLTANLSPKIRGKSVYWTIPAGSALKFEAGAQAGQYVDMIRVIPAARAKKLAVDAVAAD
jgi:hypothetical protein